MCLFSFDGYPYPQEMFLRDIDHRAAGASPVRDDDHIIFTEMSVPDQLTDTHLARGLFIGNERDADGTSAELLRFEDNLTGVLTLKDLPYLDTRIELSIDLDSMSGSPDLAHSGYLTKGDKNDYFDQVTSIHPGPVEKEDLKAIAGKEIPWLGCIKRV